MITHHPQSPLGHRDVEGRLGGDVPRVQVVLVQGDTVDGDASLGVAALDPVPAYSDDPLDEILLVVGRQQADEGEAFLDLLDDDGVVLLDGLLALEPAAGIAEDDDVPALRLGAEPGGELVHQDAVTDPDGLLHGARGDHERLDEKGLQHQRNEDGHADEERYLFDRAAPAASPDLALQLAPLGTGPAAGRRPGAP
ncbi:hypothetical protein GCM10010279_56300 [Streptomyces mutabilis]|nr:hypothetical protein GCM10010279_56300 [Streptomyces mutabilis]